MVGPPPAAVKSPLVMVDEAVERNPAERVPRPERFKAPPKVFVPVVVKLPTIVEEASER